MEVLIDEFCDIFVSYRFKDGELISQKVADALKDMGYSVYHNTDRNHKGTFPDRLKRVISNSKDFLLIVTENCLERLIADSDPDSPDWVKEELQEAMKLGKNIIPVMIEGIDWPHLAGLSEEAASLINYLSRRENIKLPFNFEKEPPLILLCGKLDSKPNAGGKFRHQKNDPKYVNLDVLCTRLKQEANEGNPAAMYQLAIFYRNGLAGEARDSVNEYYWLKKLLEVNDESDEVKKYKAHALWHIGGMYYNGEVPDSKQSITESYKYKERAEKLCPNDFPSNALSKSWASGVEFNYEDIIRTFESIDLESADAIIILHMAEFYDKYGNFASAIDLYSRISHIYNNASYRLGRLYLLGVDSTPPEPNGILAAFYFKEAADKGHTDAAYELGRLYFNPPVSKTRSKNIHQDIEKAVKYFKIAAKNNHNAALYLLEWIYSHNLGIDQNFHKAIEYGEKAARDGSIDAMVTLIRLYQYEESKNYERACYHAVKATEGNRGAALYAGYFFLFGCGCEPNLNEAKKYFKIACDKQQAPEAEYMLNLINEIEQKGSIS
ncbi:MAG: toll/interleukin-1 receptor domain-containing protein [Synergistaceae bacterium]|nr:toll/interleukin-1 receptor domain-containing protein [Synergistaceae bacterium]